MPIKLAQGRFKIRDELRVTPLARGGARDDDIIGPRPPLARQHFRGHRSQSSLSAIARHRITDPAAGREPNPHNAALGTDRLWCGLQNKRRPHGPAASGGNTNKIGAGLEPYKSGCHGSHPARAFGARQDSGTQPKSSGRQALAALRASRRQYAATAGRGHSRTKAMSALADEFAGLVSALHGTGSNGDCLD